MGAPDLVAIEAKFAGCGADAAFGTTAPYFWLNLSRNYFHLPLFSQPHPHQP
jgi:hypothetical protein